MDVARLASQAQNEYGNYRAWLYGESLKCARDVKSGQALARRSLSVDAQNNSGGMDAGGFNRIAAVSTMGAGISGREKSAELQNPDSGTPPNPVTGGTQVSPQPLTIAGLPEITASEITLLERWRYYSSERAKLEKDIDYTDGFLNSRELRDCRCQRANPSNTVKRVEGKENVQQLLADDAKNNTCELCLLDAFVSWKVRSQKWCKQMATLTDFEIGVLEKSDEGTGIPKRCFDEARAARGLKSSNANPTNNTLGNNLISPGNSNNSGSGNAQNPGNKSVVPPGTAVVIVPVNPAAGNNGAGTAAPRVEIRGQAAERAESYRTSEDYAPIPLREPGRLYVRLFMSSACSAEILPGPMKARTGDLMPIAYGSKNVTVKSPCGGLAEVYFGQEEKPRVSEVFGRDQPLSLQFEPQ